MTDVAHLWEAYKDALLYIDQLEQASAAPPAIRPIIKTAPLLSGTGAVGAALNCTSGVWFGKPTAYAYQWGANGISVGTNSANYTVVSGDVGKTMKCMVTATNATGTTQEFSSNTIAAHL